MSLSTLFRVRILSLLLSTGVFAVFGASPNDWNCLHFDMHGRIVSVPTCTLSVSVCKPVHAVTITARYSMHNPPRDTTVVITTLKRPPYKMIWDLSSIPNQLYTGARLEARANTVSGTTMQASYAGLFLQHKKITRPEGIVGFCSEQTHQYGGTPLFTFEGPNNNKIRCTGCRDNDSLYLLIEVRDRLYRPDHPLALAGRLRAEIAIDPFVGRLPYPDSTQLFITIPFKKKAFRTVYHTIRMPGKDVEYKKTTHPLRSIRLSRSSQVFEGVRFSLAIPFSLLGGRVPDSLAGNFLFSTPVNDSLSGTISWTPTFGNESYVPATWGTLRFAPRPFFTRLAVVWVLWFLGGFTGTLLLGILLRGLRRRGNSLNRFTHSEDDKELLERLQAEIHAHVLRKEFSLSEASGLLDAPPRRINRLMKKATGLSFTHYFMKAKIEIAKERLRSSHTSEAFIARSCGFKSMDDFEKYFHKFVGCTPHRFREKHHVT